MKLKFWKSGQLPLDMQCQVNHHIWYEHKCHDRKVSGWELCSYHLRQYLNKGYK